MIWVNLVDDIVGWVFARFNLASCLSMLNLRLYAAFIGLKTTSFNHNLFN